MADHGGSNSGSHLHTNHNHSVAHTATGINVANMHHSGELVERTRPPETSEALGTEPTDESPAPQLRRVAMETMHTEKPSARRSMILGAAALSVCILAFIGQTVVTRQVQESYVQPYFILWISHSFWIIMLPLHVAYEKLKRSPRSLAMLRMEALVGSATLAVQQKRSGSRHGEYQQLEAAAAGSEGGSARALALARPAWVVWRTVALAVALAGLLNGSAYLWYVAIGFTSMSKVTAIYNMSCFFAYLFSVLLLRERVRLVKCAAVGASIVGVVFMTTVDSDGDALSAEARRSEMIGDVLSLVCACGIGLYQVLYKKYAVPGGFHSLFHVNFMTTLLGVATVAVYWLPIPALSALGVEVFRWPNRAQLAFIVANALFGVAYNACFMIALALTSPL
ncbi:hypothetical protein LPJ66_011369, partial [Kickxella alabastrina]